MYNKTTKITNNRIQQIKQDKEKLYWRRSLPVVYGNMWINSCCQVFIPNAKCYNSTCILKPLKRVSCYPVRDLRQGQTLLEAMTPVAAAGRIGGVEPSC